MVNKGIKEGTGYRNGSHQLALGYILQAFMDYSAKRYNIRIISRRAPNVPIIEEDTFPSTITYKKADPTYKQ